MGNKKSAVDSSNSRDELILTSFFDSGQQLSHTQSEQILYLLTEIRSPNEEQEKELLPLNIVLVIDRSTSMQGKRIDKVKSAAGMIVENLASRDRIAIISFSDRAEVVVPATQPKNKPALISKIQGIMPSGGTEIFQGLSAGFKELNKVNLNNYINHLILLTDGHTYGDDAQCLNLAQKAASVGIGISAFGIGSEWNDQFLDLLVTPSGGQSGYIAEPEQVIHLLRQRIQSLGKLYAQNVRLVPHLPPGITIKDGFKLTPFSQPLNHAGLVLQLGPIEGHTSLSFLLELLIEPEVTHSSEVGISFEIKADIATDPLQRYHKTVAHTIQIGSDDHHGHDTEMAPFLVQAVQLLNLYRMNENIWTDLSKGENIGNATQKLDLLTRRFKEAGLNHIAQEIGTQTKVLKDGGEFTESGRKQIKYGTRLQLTSSLQLALTQHHSSGLLGN